MAPFSDLPNELLQRVLDLLDPRDLENFTFAGKSLYLLAVKHLQRHRALKKRYNKVATSDANPISGFSTGDTMHHWQLLKEVKLHPWKRSYVTMLHVEYRYGYWDAEYDLFDTYILPCDDTTTAEMEKVGSDSAFEDSENIDFQKLEVSKGEEDQVIIFLLLELSSLKKLTLEVDCSHGSCFYEMLRWHADMPGPPSLSHLESVTIRTLDHSDEWSLLSTFAAIPPVKSLVDTLSKLLHGIRSLKSFSYDLAGWAVDADTFLTTHNALLAHTKTSLEVLSLRDSDYTQQHMLGFRDFNALKELTIDFVLLMGSKPSTTRKLPDILPASIEIVTLFECQIYSVHWFLSIMNSLLANKGNLVPKLKELRFVKTVHLERWWEEVHEPTAIRAETAEFSLSVT